MSPTAANQIVQCSINYKSTLGFEDISNVKDTFAKHFCVVGYTSLELEFSFCHSTEGKVTTCISNF